LAFALVAIFNKVTTTDVYFTTGTRLVHSPTNITTVYPWQVRPNLRLRGGATEDVQGYNRIMRIQELPHAQLHKQHNFTLKLLQATLPPLDAKFPSELILQCPITDWVTRVELTHTLRHLLQHMQRGDTVLLRGTTAVTRNARSHTALAPYAHLPTTQYDLHLGRDPATQTVAIHRHGQPLHGHDPPQNWTYIDLAAGIGGFSVAADHLGGRLKAAIDNDPETVDVLRANQPPDAHKHIHTASITDKTH